MDSPAKVSDFYDKWVTNQVNVGVNLRHRTILRLLKREGMARTDSVLEIGCGIGTVTGLVAQYLNKGKIRAVDISPMSIEQARERLARFGNIDFQVSDMSDFDATTRYDVVFLPDVLEHIPVEAHRNLFKTIRTVLKDTGFVLIHIPNPRYLDWVRKNQPEKLQIIDQSLHTYPMLEDIYANGLYLHRLTSHSIFHECSDYQMLVLRCNDPLVVAPPLGKYMLRLRNFVSRFIG